MKKPIYESNKQSTRKISFFFCSYGFIIHLSKKVLERAWSFTANKGYLIVLVKPQFECTKEEADKGRGVIRNNEIHQRVINEILQFSEKNLMYASFIIQTESSPKGNEGNTEFFLCWKKEV